VVCRTLRTVTGASPIVADRRAHSPHDLSLSGGSYPVGFVRSRVWLPRHDPAPPFAAGAKDLRFALPNARIMVHQPSGGFQGQATDIMLHAQEILNLKRRLNEISA